MIFFIFVTPLLQLVLFGYVATFDVNNIKTAFYDLDKSYESRSWRGGLESSGYFTIGTGPSPGRGEGPSRQGKALCVIQINRDFART